MKRVVVTGMGAITPVGNDIDTFWNNLTAGKNGVGMITRFDTSRPEGQGGRRGQGLRPAAVH